MYGSTYRKPVVRLCPRRSVPTRGRSAALAPAAHSSYPLIGHGPVPTGSGMARGRGFSATKVLHFKTAGGRGCALADSTGGAVARGTVMHASRATRRVYARQQCAHPNFFARSALQTALGLLFCSAASRIIWHCKTNEALERRVPSARSAPNASAAHMDIHEAGHLARIPLTSRVTAKCPAFFFARGFAAALGPMTPGSRQSSCDRRR